MLRDGGLLAKLPARERFLADKGYEGEERALTPFKGKDLPPEQKQFNRALAARRNIVEITNAWLKNFQALQMTWRESFDKHQKIFLIIANIVNSKKRLG